MNDFDLITFDYYGTLIDWETGIADAFRNEVAHFKETMSRKGTARWLRRI